MNDVRRAGKWPRRRGLIDEPARGRSVPGVSTLTFPDPGEVFAVIDVALFGEKEAGKTQFVLNARATLKAQSPEAEDTWVLDPARTRTLPTATDCLVPRVCRVPFRKLAPWLTVRMLFSLAIRKWWVWLHFVIVSLCAVALLQRAREQAGNLEPVDWALIPAAYFIAGCIWIIVSFWRFLVRTRSMDVEIVFWDIAGEHLYDANNAGEIERYRNTLKHLIDSRMAIAQREGYRYLFAPVLICNPLSVVHPAADTPFVRLQRIMFQFQGLFRNAAQQDSQLLSVVTRGDLVSFLEDMRRLPTDRPLRIYSMRRGDNPYRTEPIETNVYKKSMLEACVDRQWDADAGYTMRYDASIGTVFTYDGWLKEQSTRSTYWVPERVHHHCQLFYEFRESPEGFKGKNKDTFLRWLTGQLWRTRAPSAWESYQGNPPLLQELRQTERPRGSEYQPGS